MATSKRDLRYDSLRGLMLVCMTINHLPSILRVVTDESLGLFGAAEGFVFLSGLLAGIVYTRRLRSEGPVGLRRIVERRANLIYGWQVGSLLVCLVAVQLASHIFGFCSWTSPLLFYTHPWLAAGLGLAMLHQPGLLDVLPMYCGFVLLLPYVLRALEAGHRGRVIALSALSWFAVQFTAPLDSVNMAPLNLGTFNLFAWQLLFVIGVVIGHARVSTTEAQIPKRPWLVALASGIALYCGLLQNLHWKPLWSDRMFGILLYKPSLGALRLGDFAIVAYLVAVVGARWPSLLTWRPLAFLGRHSLPVVAAQSVIAMIVLQFSGLFTSTVGNLAVSGACVGFLFASAAVHQAWQIRAAKNEGHDGSEPMPFDARHASGLALSRPHDARAA